MIENDQRMIDKKNFVYGFSYEASHMFVTLPISNPLLDGFTMWLAYFNISISFWSS